MKIFMLPLLLVSFASAWFGENGPDPLEKAEADARAKYPVERYFWGIGESRTSAGEAEMRARTRISEQIDLAIKSTMTSLMQEESQGKSSALSSKVVWENSAETRFENAQIIHCDAPHKVSDGRWLVTASLSRDEALGALTQAYEDTARRFRTRGRAALAAGDLGSFTSPWREAMRLGGWLKLQGVRFLSIANLPLNSETMSAKHPHALFYGSDMLLLQQLDSARSSQLARQRVSLKLDNFPAFQPQAAQVLKNAGIPVAAERAEWTLSLRWEKTESESAIGEISRCRLVPTLDLQHVSGTNFSSPSLQDAAGEGYKVRDPTGACADAMDKVDAAPLEPALQALLRSAFPIP